MTVTIDYYFSLLSPWAYIGHKAFHDAMNRTGAAIAYKPINVPEAFQASETPLLGNRHITRQQYRTLELQRWGVKRGLEFNYWPAHWPFAAATGDKMIMACCAKNNDPASFIGQVLSGIWERETNYNDEAELVAAANAGGLDGDGLLADAKGGKFDAAYEANTQEAIGAGVFGVPAYIYKGEFFWGQDRIDLLEDAIRSGRDGFTPVMPG
ncbi:MAG: 2-hydroxychromene-2-carboxylate isomerase [Hyphomicrobiales bacterium]